MSGRKCSWLMMLLALEVCICHGNGRLCMLAACRVRDREFVKWGRIGEGSVNPGSFQIRR